MNDLLSELTEDVPLRQRPVYTKVQLKRLITIALIVLSSMTLAGGTFSNYLLSETSVLYLEDYIKNYAIINFLVVPFLALVVSTLVALVPMKQRSYKMKWLPVWLWTTAIISVAFTGSLLLSLAGILQVFPK